MSKSLNMKPSLVNFENGMAEASTRVGSIYDNKL